MRVNKCRNDCRIILGGGESFSERTQNSHQTQLPTLSIIIIPQPQLMFHSITKRFMASFGSLLPPGSPTANQQLMRLSKWMSMKSLCSRREAEEIIGMGLVRIDGKRVFENCIVPITAEMKAFTPIGLQVERPITKLWMMNKPRNCICTHNDPQKRRTVYSLLPPGFQEFGHIMSVGRLDYNSEGLLLLTNDTTLKSLLENPHSNLSRYYRVKVHGRVTEDKLSKLNKPMQINGKTYGPLRVTMDRELSTNAWLDVSMKTGKNREIRRIFQKCDLQVNKLIRREYGPYKLTSSLLHGEIREIPISPGLERKIKIQKAQQFSHLPKCLIEIDIREKALELAHQEHIKRVPASQKPKALDSLNDDEDDE